VQVKIGKDVDLSISLKRNRFPFSGQAVTVRVVDLDGVELLASTVVPETPEPGLYKYTWTDPPSEESSLAAIFKVKSRCYTEDVNIVSSSGGGGGSEFIGFIDVSDNPIQGEVDDTELSGEVSDTELSGTISTDPDIVGEISDTELIGEVEEDC